MSGIKDTDDKKQETEKKENGILNIIKEVNKRERQDKLRHQADIAKKAAEEEARTKEEYSKKLQEEKLELIKIKQGLSITAESEENQEEKKHYNIAQKISSFIYRNKAMVILGTFALFIVGFLTIDFIKKDRPDMTIMVLINDQEFDYGKEEISKIFENYIDDVNGNGEIHVTTFYMPVSQEIDPYTLSANSTKLFAFMQAGQDMIIMADKDVYEKIYPEVTLYNLQSDYPDNANIKDYGFYFSGTDFLDDIGYQGDASDEYYIGIRKVSEGAKYKDQMQKNFDIAYDALKQFIDQYS